MQKVLKVMILVGSPRQESKTLYIAKHIQKGLIEANCQVELWDQGTAPIPLMQPDQRSQPNLIQDNNLKQFLNSCYMCDAMVWATPVYHGSISGGIKNALDWLSSSFMKEKTVGFICHSGGMRKTHPLLELRSIARALGTYAMIQEVSTSDLDFSCGIDGMKLTSQDVKNRLADFVSSLLSFNLMTQQTSPIVTT